MKTALLLRTDAVPTWAPEGVVYCIAGWPQSSRQSSDVARRNLTASPVSWLQSFFPRHLVAAAEVWKSATNVPVLENAQIVLAEALSEDSQHFQSKTTKIKRKCTFTESQAVNYIKTSEEFSLQDKQKLCMKGYFRYFDLLQLARLHSKRKKVFSVMQYSPTHSII